jgi:hypothetical protein
MKLYAIINNEKLFQVSHSGNLSLVTGELLASTENVDLVRLTVHKSNLKRRLDISYQMKKDGNCIHTEAVTVEDGNILRYHTQDDEFQGKLKEIFLDRKGIGEHICLLSKMIGDLSRFPVEHSVSEDNREFVLLEAYTPERREIVSIKIID